MRATPHARQTLTHLLLDGGADVNLKDVQGRTTLMYATGEAPRHGDIRVLGREASTRDPGGVRAQWSDDERAMRLAKAYRGRAEAVGFLLSRGADPRQRDEACRPALDVALENATVVGDDNAEVIAALRAGSGSDRNFLISDGAS